MRTIPAVRAIHTTFAGEGVVVIGVHSPEFAYERNAANVAAAVRDRQIPYPVALDNSFAIWRAFGVRAWPTTIVLDRDGRAVFTHVGELHRGTPAWSSVVDVIRSALRTPPSRGGD